MTWISVENQALGPLGVTFEVILNCKFPRNVCQRKLRLKETKLETRTTAGFCGTFMGWHGFFPKSLTLWSPKSDMESLRQNSWLSWQSHNTSSRAGMCWLATDRVLYLFDCATYSPAVSMRFDSSSRTFTSVVQAPLGHRTSYHSPERTFPTDPVSWNELRTRALHEIGPWTH